MPRVLHGSVGWVGPDSRAQLSGSVQAMGCAPLPPLPVPPLESQPPPGDSALSTASSMSPESFVSGVVRAHLCARACAWGPGVLSCLRAVWAGEGWPVFTLSVFLLVFFLFPPHPHRTLPSTQTLISQIREKVGPFHFLSIYRSPVDGMLPPVGTSGHGQLPGLAPAWPARQSGSAVYCLGQKAGRTRGGWAVPLAPHVPAAWVPDTPVSACSFSWAALQGWASLVHGTKLHFTVVPGLGQPSVPGEIQVGYGSEELSCSTCAWGLPAT